MRWWKILGLAGVAGVATAVGVTMARRHRAWSEVDVDELRTRLHQRFEDRTMDKAATP